MDKLTERLIQAYHEIRHILQEICNAGPGEPFATLLGQAAAKNSVVQAYERELTNLNALRHIIIDSFFDEPIATPTLAVVKKLEKIKESLQRPPLIGRRFKTAVAVCAVTDPISKVVAKMRKGNFSQLPVYDGPALAALLTTDTVARWFSVCFSRDGGIVDETQVRSVLQEAETPDNYAFMAPSDTVFKALKCVLDRQTAGKRCDAIVITQDGGRTSKAVGLITLSDIPRLYEAIRAGSQVPAYNRGK